MPLAFCLHCESPWSISCLFLTKGSCTKLAPNSCLLSLHCSHCKIRMPLLFFPHSSNRILSMASNCLEMSAWSLLWELFSQINKVFLAFYQFGKQILCSESLEAQLDSRTVTPLPPTQQLDPVLWRCEIPSVWTRCKTCCFSCCFCRWYWQGLIPKWTSSCC